MSENNNILRLRYPIQLAKKFLEDAKDAIKHFKHSEQIELTEHLLKVLDLIGEYSVAREEQFYKKFHTSS